MASSWNWNKDSARFERWAVVAPCAVAIVSKVMNGPRLSKDRCWPEEVTAKQAMVGRMMRRIFVDKINEEMDRLYSNVPMSATIIPLRVVPHENVLEKPACIVEPDKAAVMCEPTGSSADDMVAMATMQDMGRVVVMQDEALPVEEFGGMMKKFVTSETDAILRHATMCKSAAEHDKAYIGADFGLTTSKNIIYGKPHESSSRPDAVLPSCEIGAKNGCNGMCAKCNGSKQV